MKKLFTLSLVLFFAFALTGTYAYAQNFDVSAYRKYKIIDNLSIKTPTVVEIPINEKNYRNSFAVLDSTLNMQEPYYLKQDMPKYEVTPSISADTNVINLAALVDRDLSTYAEFSVPFKSNGYARITWTSSKPITSTSLTILLDNYVTLPDLVEISAVVDGKETIVVANKTLDQNTIYFPKTTASSWRISFWYYQPLRIKELEFNQDDSSKDTLNSIRFLAQPGHSYFVYFDPDRVATLPMQEATNLSSVKEVMKLTNIVTKSNPRYTVADSDMDGIPDLQDNCANFPNVDQVDINHNNIGDVCDDFDVDGIINANDNCPNNPNVNQQDIDGDKVGDVCDGQESRLTEKYPWLPWIGIVSAVAVLIYLFAITAKSKPSQSNIS